MTSGQNKIDPRTPILVGQAQVAQHIDNLESAAGPIELMSQAVREAFADAGIQNTGTKNATTIDALRVVRSLSTRNTNPARDIASILEISANEYGLTPHGGNMPQYLVNCAALQIRDNGAQMIVLTGGESFRSRRRARAAQMTLPWMELKEGQELQAPTALGEDLVMNHEIELAHKIMLPIEIYPMFETALRYRDKRTVADHQKYISELWARFSDVAATNPHAWIQQKYTAEAIRTPTQDNRMIGFPYTKLMNSNNDVDMAAALVMCSVERAEALGIARDKWIFLHAGTDCHEHNFVSHRYSFTDTPAIRIGGQRVLALAEKSIDEIENLDLYSCFPSAVQLGAESLGVSLDRQLTCTGGLSFAGGPFNNYVMHAIATTMTTLREKPQETGLVWANGGYATKHAFGVYATTPPLHGFRHESPQSEVDSLPRREVATAIDAQGPATVEAYSVMHDRDGAAEKVRASVLLADGRRAWATSDNTQLGTDMCENEWVGKTVTLDETGAISV
ncbi:MAG: acetyl-CoA acetyltransferase [Ilumatobacteraceae bacterium]|nr:acetyl-CoA acetyltransferase [Ilumatobacteraceae bacterium]